jgi:Ni,Fe-hydrogenase III large subunit
MGVIFPLGPYHPAIFEPLALRLRLRGEHIVGVNEPEAGSNGYSYRGVLALIEGLPLDDALVILERVCAHSGQSYRQALCLAVEKIVRSQLGRPAALVRTLFAELERLQSALWSLGEISRAVDQRRHWVEALEQRERLFEAAQAATGERVFWGVALPGGVREGITLEPLRDFASSATTLYETWRAAAATNSPLRRATEGLGRQEADGALDAAAVYGSCLHDTRRETPYDAYRMMTLDWEPLDTLDSAPLDIGVEVARLVAGLKLSIDIIVTCLEELDGEPNLPRATLKFTAGEGSALVQTPHGPARVSVTLKADGAVVALALQTSCADRIQLIPHVLTNRALGEAPALLAALDLCPSCAEL